MFVKNGSGPTIDGQRRGASMFANRRHSWLVAMRGLQSICVDIDQPTLTMRAARQVGVLGGGSSTALSLVKVGPSQRMSAMILSQQFWTVLLRPAVLPFFVLALIDGLMTIYGTSRAVGGPASVSAIIGLIVGLGVLITLLSTFDIWGSWHPVLRESAIMTQLLRAIWVIAFLYDWGTSLVAIIDLAGLGDHSFSLLQVTTADRLGLLRLIVAGTAALVVCGSTVVISFMAYNERRERAAEG
jgi:hypothetical protein